ncbi:hypothetical protein [Chthonobacter albigriseus]|uniref:hypothetical protein n=1 Tax=Chthonobacter albigriseus TaxID=1683161 RepID=UPI0015EFAA70|nr:hypothetical protein [Chthonobacter albigriseus]
MKTIASVTSQALLCTLAVLAIALSPKPGGHVAVILGPGSSEPAAVGAIAAADGLLVDGTGQSWIVVARSDNPDFVSALYAAGAWLVIDAGFGFGCTNKDVKETRS